MSDPLLTCLIPAFNEAARIGRVLEAVKDHPMIGHTLVIDDGSTDDTADIARTCGARVIRTPGNQGKARALVAGLKTIESGHVLLLDADLIGLTSLSITALATPVVDGTAAAALSLRGNAPLVWRMIGVDYITGERVLPYSLLAPQLEQIAALPSFGFEVFLNELLIAAGKPVAIVAWPDVASPSKANKRGFAAGARADILMMGDIFRTVGPIDCLKQIRALQRLRSGPAPRWAIRASGRRLKLRWLGRQPLMRAVARKIKAKRPNLPGSA